MNSAGPATRPYRLGRRAEAARRTADAIIEAALALMPGRPWDDVTLEAVAARAGVTERTVLRRFGSKEGLARACAARAGEAIRAQRRGEPGTSLEDAMAELVEHYEAHGDTALWLLDEGRRVPVLAEAAAGGTALHQAWVARVFGDRLGALGLPAAERRRRLAALGAATDVHTWDILRRRSGLTRRDTEAALVTLCGGLLRDERGDRACAS